LGYRLSDVRVCIHNHPGLPRPSSRDKNFYAYLQDHGFIGDFCRLLSDVQKGSCRTKKENRMTTVQQDNKWDPLIEQIEQAKELPEKLASGDNGQDDGR